MYFGIIMSLNAYFNKRLLRDSLKMINPVILTLLIAIFLTAIITVQYFPEGQTVTQDQQINIVKENPNGDPTSAVGAGLANALIFVGITLIGGFIFIFFIKYGLDKLMNLLLAGTFFISVLSFSIIILPAVFFPLFDYFNLLNLFGQTQEVFNTNFTYFIVLLSLLFATINFIGFTIIKNQYLHNVLMISFGVSMGVIFGIFFDSFSLIFVLVALALYDIYAVFRGPLKNMFDRLDMKAEREQLGASENWNDSIEKNTTPSTSQVDYETNYKSNSTQNNGESIRIPRKVKNPQISQGFTLPVYATPFITIGLGDFAFFSVLISKATYLAIKGDFLILPATANGAIYWDLILLPFIGLILGCYLTFVLLQKYEILPALPLPISGGLIGLFLALLLQLLI